MKSFDMVAAASGIALAVTLAGCSGEPDRARRDADKTTPTVAESERPGSNQPGDINPVTARMRVSDLKVGTALGADGKVTEAEGSLHPGDPIQASIAVGDVGAGSSLKAVWLGPAGQRLGDEVKSVEAGAAFVVFRAPATASWTTGEHKLEIYLGDELAASDSFQVLAQAPPA